MKKIISGILLVCFTILIMLSCGKTNQNGIDGKPIDYLQSQMSDGPWQLTSFTRYDSSGMISRYQGTVMDTLQFGYTADANQNVVTTSVGFYIRGVYTVCPYKYHLQDTTILLGPSCRANYNDAIKLTSWSDQLAVFKVKFDSANINGWEIDSLKKIHFD